MIKLEKRILKSLLATASKDKIVTNFNSVCFDIFPNYFVACSTDGNVLTALTGTHEEEVPNGHLRLVFSVSDIENLLKINKNQVSVLEIEPKKLFATETQFSIDCISETRFVPYETILKGLKDFSLSFERTENVSKYVRTSFVHLSKILKSAESLGEYAVSGMRTIIAKNHINNEHEIYWTYTEGVFDSYSVLWLSMPMITKECEDSNYHISNSPLTKINELFNLQ